MDNEDVGKPVSDYFGVSDSPTVKFLALFFIFSPFLKFIFIGVTHQF